MNSSASFGIIFLVIVFITSVNARVWYVSNSFDPLKPNCGTQTIPCGQRVLLASNSGRFKAGDEVVLDTSFSGKHVTIQALSGTVAKPIVVKALSALGSAGLTTSKHVVLQSLSINRLSAAGLSIYDSENVTVSEARISGPKPTTRVTNPSDNSAILVHGSTGVTIQKSSLKNGSPCVSIRDGVRTKSQVYISTTNTFNNCSPVSAKIQ